MALAALCKVVSLDLRHLMAILPSSWGDPSLTCSSFVFIQLEYSQLNSGIGLLHDVTSEAALPSTKAQNLPEVPAAFRKGAAAHYRAIISPAIPLFPCGVKELLECHREEARM